MTLENKFELLLSENGFRLARRDRRRAFYKRSDGRSFATFPISDPNTQILKSIENLNRALDLPPRPDVVVIAESKKEEACFKIEEKARLSETATARSAHRRLQAEANKQAVRDQQAAAQARKVVADAEKKEEVAIRKVLKSKIDIVLAAWRDRKEKINEEYRATFIADVQEAIRDYDAIAERVRPVDIHKIKSGKPVGALPFELVTVSKAAGMSPERAKAFFGRLISASPGENVITTGSKRWTYRSPCVSDKTNKVIRESMTHLFDSIRSGRKPKPLVRFLSSLTPGDEHDLLAFLESERMKHAGTVVTP